MFLNQEGDFGGLWAYMPKSPEEETIINHSSCWIQKSLLAMASNQTENISVCVFRLKY